MSIFDTLNPARKTQPVTQKELSGFSGSNGFNISFTSDSFDISNANLYHKGYKSNPYVYAVVSRLSFLMAQIPFKVSKITDVSKQAKYKGMTWEQKTSRKGQLLKEEAIEDVPGHPLQEILDYPNNEMEGFEFRQALYINKLLTGNAYGQAMRRDERPPTELWVLPPMAVTLQSSGNFYNKVKSARFSWNATQKEIESQNLFHSKYYDPMGSVYGLSPLVAARKAIQQVNAGDEHNAALLQNGAKPEFIIIVPDGTTDEQKENLKERFVQEYGGKYKGTMKPIVADESFMRIEQLGYTMKDMDWQASQLNNMRKVYDVFGVGSEIFNDPENKIQANKEEAIRSLYTDRVLPEADNFKGEFERFLLPMYPEDNLMIAIDTSAVAALNEERNKIAERMEKVDYFTENEKRAEMGAERIDEEWADMVWKDARKVPAQSLGDVQLEDAKEIYNFDEIKLNGLAHAHK